MLLRVSCYKFTFSRSKPCRFCIKCAVECSYLRYYVHELRRNENRRSPTGDGWQATSCVFCEPHTLYVNPTYVSKQISKSLQNIDVPDNSVYLYLNINTLYLSINSLYLSINTLYLSINTLYLSINTLYLSINTLYLSINTLCKWSKLAAFLHLSTYPYHL